MSQSAIKFYLVPGIIGIIIVIIVLIVPFGEKKVTTVNPTPTSELIIPTLKFPTRSPFPTNGPSPTTIPIQEFTGADIDQELPADVRDLGQQKTTLRRQTPLTLEFATISFDYENDQFVVMLLEPTELSRNQFTIWITNNYPALSLDKFAFQ